MQRHSYTASEKAHALELYAEHGAAETARMTGIAKGTLQSWAHRSGVRSVATERTQAAVQAMQAQWNERRLVMIHEIGAVAHMALLRTEQSITTARSREAKEFATTMAILVDKAQLLSGDPTARTETVAKDSLDREIERLFEHAS